MRMSAGLDLRQEGWNGDGTGTDGALEALLAGMPGIVRDGNVGVGFTEWNCRSGENNVIVRTDGTCQKNCFSTLNHNPGYCYNDPRVIKFLWQQARNGFKGGARSFED